MTSHNLIKRLPNDPNMDTLHITRESLVPLNILHKVRQLEPRKTQGLVINRQYSAIPFLIDGEWQVVFPRNQGPCAGGKQEMEVGGLMCVAEDDGGDLGGQVQEIDLRDHAGLLGGRPGRSA